MRIRSWKVRPALVTGGLFMLALLPRVVAPAPFIAWDELFWTHGSVAFWTALLQGRLAGTFIIGQPGVPVLWVSGLAALLGALVRPGGWQAFSTLGAGPGYLAFDADLLRQAAQFLPAARWGVALLSAGVVAGAYALGRRVFGARVALLGAVLLAFDPYFLAHSRAAALDATLAGLMLLAFLALLAYARRPSPRALVLAGVLAGAAVSAKLPALYLVLVAAVVLLIAAWKNRLPAAAGNGPGAPEMREDRGRVPVPWALMLRRVALRLVRDGLLWGGAALATFFVLWPALWAAPLQTVEKLVATVAEYNARPDSANFFLGQTVGDPGPAFYPVVLAFALTALTSAGLAAWLAGLAWKPARRLPAGALAAYALGFLALLSLSPSKYARYTLPAAVALDLLAAAGLVGWLEALGMRTGVRRALQVGLSLAVIGQIGWTLAGHPNYLATYNPLLGGTRAAARTISVGWGEGLDQVATWLNGKPDADRLKVALWPMAGLAPRFSGETYLLDEHGLVVADYVVVYLGDAQFRSLRTERFYGVAEPLFTARLRGVGYAWVYRNVSYEAELDYIQAHAGPEDLVLLDVDAQLGRHYSGPQQVLVLDGTMTAETMAQRLNEAAAGRPRIWYMRYRLVDSQTRPLLTEFLVDDTTYLAHVDFDSGRLVVFRPPALPLFGAP
ncbi:MAG TPA: glycosyltransferase family 39 protein [Anaerolineae bacterium]|nr:glycosyltransferase family 39 protein [Anaerolineae bacterium]